MTAQIDPRDYRSALGHFATGVTIVTTATPRGTPGGLTVNSFNSVSLDPPLVLWSLSRKARCRPDFLDTEYFAVNVLAADQAELAGRFASKIDDKFAGVDHTAGTGGIPLIDGCAARFQCRVHFRHGGGDHLIFVGEVIGFDESGKLALVFHRGRYTTAGAGAAGDGRQARGFVNDYLLYLLTRASRQLNNEFLQHLREAGLEPRHWRVLATLSDDDGRTVAELATTTLMPPEVLATELEEMEREGLIEQRPSADGTRVHVTEAGYGRVVNLLAAAKAHEADVLSGIDAEDGRALKRALRRLIEQTG